MMRDKIKLDSFELFEGRVHTEEVGSGKPIIGVVVCVHGNEQAGLATFDAIKKQELLHGTVKLIVANPAALKLNKRFIDADLNRVFPGRVDGNYEERLAYQIKNELSNCDYVIDIHTSEAPTLPYAISIKEDKRFIELAKKIGIGKIVYMSSDLAKGKSLLDSCNYGISIECGQHSEPETRSVCINAVLSFLGNMNIITCFENRAESVEEYRVIGLIKKPDAEFESSLESFRKVSRGNTLAETKSTKLIAKEDFYPILAGEPEYTDVLCLVGQKLNEEK